MIRTNPTTKAAAIAVLVRGSEIYSINYNKPITAFVENLKDNKTCDPQMREALTQALLERQVRKLKMEKVTKAAREVIQLTNNLEKVFQSIYSVMKYDGR